MEIIITDTTNDISHVATSWKEFTRMLFNLGPRNGLHGETLAMLIGAAIDGILMNNPNQVLASEAQFRVEFDWSPAQFEK